ncbi:MAG: dual specificity protein phosphatase family protein [Thermodesulfobacteriota bacterium]
MPQRFSWVIEDRLAGMERPGLFYHHEDDMEFLRERGIEVIISLEEKKYFRDYSGFIVKHIPIDDLKAPALSDFSDFAAFVQFQLSINRRVVVHCYAGMGRTNLMIACFLIHQMKVDPGTALDVVKLKRPFHLVTWEQEEALKDYFLEIRDSLGISGL